MKVHRCKTAFKWRPAVFRTMPQGEFKHHQDQQGKEEKPADVAQGKAGENSIQLDEVAEGTHSLPMGMIANTARRIPMIPPLQSYRR